MYCPNCGTTTSTQQKFCRSCGLALEKVAQSLSEQLPTRLEESLQQRKERIERWGVAALIVFGVGVLSIPFYQVVKMMLEGRVLAGLGLLALGLVLACGLLSVILFAKAREVGESTSRRRQELAAANPEADTTANLLPPEGLQSPVSVTDATTELLFTKKEIRNQKD